LCAGHHHWAEAPFFFGFYDMRPWDPTGRYHLVLEVDFADRPPGPDDEAVVGVVDLATAGRFLPLTRTRTWNFQQGAMLHWLVGPDRTVLSNVRREGRLVRVAHAMASGRERIVGPAIAALSEDGRFAATLNFLDDEAGLDFLALAQPADEVGVPAPAWDQQGDVFVALQRPDYHAQVLALAHFRSMGRANLPRSSPVRRRPSPAQDGGQSHPTSINPAIASLSSPAHCNLRHVPSVSTAVLWPLLPLTG